MLDRRQEICAGAVAPHGPGAHRPARFSRTAGAGQALARADRAGWTVVSMEDDWTTVF